MTQDVRERRRLSTEAKNAADRRLREAHPEEHRRYYVEEATARGIAVRGVNLSIAAAALVAAGYTITPPADR